ncbi:unnamed protein product [Prorocentrum cordatum]|uniref:K Homology domain-containing protein n=1 Tax=Prorocentrum cordatum TaxID=2364126 RepID=A0ABN9V3W2_9DINO|nr:unnamed protein product [Polarella glacialis]
MERCASGADGPTSTSSRDNRRCEGALEGEDTHTLAEPGVVAGSERLRGGPPSPPATGLLCLTVAASYTCSAATTTHIQTVCGYAAPVTITYINELVLGTVAASALLYARPPTASLALARAQAPWALVLSPTAFGANAAFAAALRLTSVASAVTLEQLTSLFIAALSYHLLGERYGLPSMLMLAVAVGGAIVATLADVSGPADLVRGISPLLGDALALLVAFCSAFYMVLFKCAFPSMDPWGLVLFFAVKATVTVGGGWIVLLVFNVLGWDHAGSPSACALAWVPIGSCLQALFNYSLIWTTIRTSPLTARLSLLCAIPISFSVDLCTGRRFDAWRLVGVLLIFGGVVGFECLPRPSVGRRAGSGGGAAAERGGEAARRVARAEAGKQFLAVSVRAPQASGTQGEPLWTRNRFWARGTSLLRGGGGGLFFDRGGARGAGRAARRPRARRCQTAGPAGMAAVDPAEAVRVALLVPDAQAGKVVGKGGAVFQMLRAQGCDIMMQQAADVEQFRRADLRGASGEHLARGFATIAGRLGKGEEHTMAVVISQDMATAFDMNHGEQMIYDTTGVAAAVEGGWTTEAAERRVMLTGDGNVLAKCFRLLLAACGLCEASGGGGQPLGRPRPAAAPKKAAAKSVAAAGAAAPAFVAPGAFVPPAAAPASAAGGARKAFVPPEAFGGGLGDGSAPKAFVSPTGFVPPAGYVPPAASGGSGAGGARVTGVAGRSDQEAELHFVASDDQVELMAGWQGANLPSFASQSGCSSISLAPAPDGSSSEVVMKGPIGAVLTAQQMLWQQLGQTSEELPDYIQMIYVAPKGRVGAVVGKAGSGLRQVRELSGLEVKVAQDEVEGWGRCTFAGAVQSALVAAELIHLLCIGKGGGTITANDLEFMSAEAARPVAPQPAAGAAQHAAKGAKGSQQSAKGSWGADAAKGSWGGKGADAAKGSWGAKGAEGAWGSTASRADAAKGSWGGKGADAAKGSWGAKGAWGSTASRADATKGSWGGSQGSWGSQKQDAWKDKDPWKDSWSQSGAWAGAEPSRKRQRASYDTSSASAGSWGGWGYS